MDTKSDLDFASPSPRKTERSRNHYLKTGSVLLTLAVLYHLTQILNFGRIPPSSTSLVADVDVNFVQKQDSWDWAAIEPSRDLEWHTCYDGTFTCARLDVSLSPISSSFSTFANEKIGTSRLARPSRS